jgi:hypothetical protein
MDMGFFYEFLMLEDTSNLQAEVWKLAWELVLDSALLVEVLVLH